VTIPGRRKIDKIPVKETEQFYRKSSGEGARKIRDNHPKEKRKRSKSILEGGEQSQQQTNRGRKGWQRYKGKEAREEL